MAKNISKVYLLDVPLEDDMKNTLYFANSSAQHSYFEGQIGKTYTNVSYQSETRTFRCPDQLDSVRQYNYIMWQNTAYSNKWFYAFIKKMTYVSDGYTDVVFEVDPLQTFMFDITIKPSFIEREHTNNDTIGSNTLPEGLETGPYIHNGNSYDNKYGGFARTITIIGVTDDSVYVPDFPAGISIIKNIYNGVYSGLTYYAIKHTSAYYNKFKDFINGYTGKLDAIYTMFEVPSTTELESNLYETSSGSGIFYVIGNVLPYDLSDISISRPATIDGISPKNNKLLTAPYNYFYISNNAGSDVDFRYEDFSSPASITFKVKFSVVAGGSIKAVPQNYLSTSGEKDNYNAGITGGKLPVCAWTTDVYTNWLTQNALNIESAEIGGFMSVAVPIAGAALGVATGGAGTIAGAALAGGALNSFNQIQDLNSELYQHSLTPPQAKGDINSGDVTYSDDKAAFTVHRMCIKAEYARVIDDYFSMYGYKTCRVKTPNVAHRANWWYTKTVNINITGNVPNDDMNKIKEAYNNGLTFWRNPSNFLNYSVSNGIV